MSDQLLEKLGRKVPAGTVLFREGQSGHEMYVVHAGKIELTRRMRDREAHMLYVPPGEFFGEMAIVNQRPRSATATAVEDSTLLVIDTRTFESMIRAKAEIAVRMIRSLAARLDQSNQLVEHLLMRDSDHRVVHILTQIAKKGTPTAEGVFLPVTLHELAGQVALDEDEAAEVVSRLATARMLEQRPDGFLVPELGRLSEFLEFLEMRERFG